MKQKQFSPLSVSELAVSLFAADKGYLDGVAVEKVGAFEEGLLRLMHSDYADLMRQLEETGNYNDEIQTALTQALDKYKANSDFS